MPRQIVTIELAGLTAGDYLAHLSEPEPAALGCGLRSITVRAEPLGHTVEAVLVWREAAPSARVAAQAAGLPLVAEVVRVEAVEVDEPPAGRPVERRVPAPARPRQGRLSGLGARAAARLAAQARPATFQPTVLRWA
ncbi:MAG TPA: hypothetical protein VGW10_03150 [Solirubrobacteraceae bacterium]|nr:hypothetical protein [Solirubrobacteraceae bacterium]